MRWEAFEIVCRKVLTNVRKKSLSDICRHNPSDNGNTGAPNGLNTCRRYIASLNVGKGQLRNGLFPLVFYLSSKMNMESTYRLSLRGDFFGAYFQSLDKVIPGLLNLLFETGGQVTLQLPESFRQWVALSARECWKDGGNIALLFVLSSGRRCFSCQELLDRCWAPSCTENRALETVWWNHSVHGEAWGHFAVIDGEVRTVCNGICPALHMSRSGLYLGAIYSLPRRFRCVESWNKM